jgi:hypothetical protein
MDATTVSFFGREVFNLKDFARIGALLICRCRHMQYSILVLMHLTYYIIFFGKCTL